MAAAKTGAGTLTCKQLVGLVEAIQTTMDDLNNANANGVFNDKEQKKQQLLIKKIGELKQNLAEKLSGNPTGATTSSISPGRRKSTSTVVPVLSEEHRDLLQDFFEGLIQDTDNKPGNLPLVRAMLNFVALDYPSLCESRALLSTAAVDGSLGFLEAFFSEPQNTAMRFDTEELLSSAMFNQQYRIPLMSLLLKFGPHLNLESCAEALAPTWGEFITDIASKKKAIAREDRNGQRQLIEKMIKHPLFPFDVLREGGDGLTMFARACLEADQPLVESLIQWKACPSINHIHADGSTALMQAVVGNNAAIVKQLLAIPGADATIEGPHGTALQLASLLKRDPAIVLALKEKQVDLASPASTQPATEPNFARGLTTSIDTSSQHSKAIAHAPHVPQTAKRASMQLPALPGGGRIPQANARNATPQAATKRVGKLATLKDAPRSVSPALNRGNPTAVGPSAAGQQQLRRGSKLPELPQQLDGKSPRSPLEAPPEQRNPRSDRLTPTATVSFVPPTATSHSTPSKSLDPLSRSNDQRFTLDVTNTTHASSDDIVIPSPRKTAKPVAAVTSQSSPTRRTFSGVQSLGGSSSKHSTLSTASKKTTQLGTTTEEEEDDEAALGSTAAGSEYSLYSMGSPMGSVAHMGRTSSCRRSATDRNDGVQEDVLQLIHEASGLRKDNHRRASMGLFTDEEFETQDSSVAHQLELKARIAHAVRKTYATRRWTPTVGSDAEDALTAFFVSCALDSDVEAANTDVVLAFLSCIELDYGFVCKDSGLIEAAAADGSVQFLEAFLKIPSARFDIAEVLCCCIFHQQFRIPLTRVLLRGLSKSQLQRIKTELWEEYNEFFADICSNKKIIPDEDRTGRQELIECMITHPILTLDPRREGNDGQTVFSRAAHEGDADLIRWCMKHKFYHNPNEVLPDGTTALIHAVYGDRVDVLAAMLSIEGANVNFAAPSSGSAYAVAKNLKREAMMQTMKKHGADDAMATSGIMTVPEIPLLASSKLEASLRSMTKTGTIHAGRRPRKSPKANVAPEVPDMYGSLRW